MPTPDLDPRGALQQIMASIVVMIAGPATENPEAYLADDGLTRAGTDLVAEARCALDALTWLAGYFGCAMLPRSERSIPGADKLGPVAVDLLRRVLLEE